MLVFCMLFFENVANLLTRFLKGFTIKLTNYKVRYVYGKNECCALVWR